MNHYGYWHRCDLLSSCLWALYHAVTAQGETHTYRVRRTRTAAKVGFRSEAKPSLFAEILFERFIAFQFSARQKE
jgi:hypothetical protein